MTSCFESLLKLNLARIVFDKKKLRIEYRKMSTIGNVTNSSKDTGSSIHWSDATIWATIAVLVFCILALLMMVYCIRQYINYRRFIARSRRVRNPTKFGRL